MAALEPSLAGSFVPRNAAVFDAAFVIWFDEHCHISRGPARFCDWFRPVGIFVRERLYRPRMGGPAPSCRAAASTPVARNSRSTAGVRCWLWYWHDGEACSSPVQCVCAAILPIAGCWFWQVPHWKRLGLVNVSGIDLSIGMLREASARRFYHRLVHGSLDDTLPFATDEFDLLVSVGVLSYIRKENRFKVLQELCVRPHQDMFTLDMLSHNNCAMRSIRVVRPGGLIEFSHRSDYVMLQGWAQVQNWIVPATRLKILMAP